MPILLQQNLKMNLLALLLSAIPLANAQSSSSPRSTPTPSPGSGSGSGSGSAFTLNIRWSNSPLKGPIHANAGSFWTGKPTASYCPENVPGCQPANTTSFVAQDGKLFLNTAVPGGQQGRFKFLFNLFCIGLRLESCFSMGFDLIPSMNPKYTRP